MDTNRFSPSTDTPPSATLSAAEEITVSSDQIRETCWDCDGSKVKAGMTCRMCKGTGEITTTPLVPKA